MLSGARPCSVNPEWHELEAIYIDQAGGVTGAIPTDAEIPGCQGVVLPPWGSDNEDALTESNGEKIGMMVQVIAVPTSPEGTGGAVGVIVLGRDNAPRSPLALELFLVHAANVERLSDCACEELSEASQPSDLLEDVGIFCDS